MGFSKDQIAATKEVFDAIDKDKSGSIDVKEFEAAINEANIEISKEEIVAKVKEADKDGSGTIDFKEFIAHLESQA